MLLSLFKAFPVGLIGCSAHVLGKYLVSSHKLGSVWENKIASNGVVGFEAHLCVPIVGSDLQVLGIPIY